MIDNREVPSCVELAIWMSEAMRGYEAGLGGHRGAANRRGTDAQAQGRASRCGARVGCVAAGGERVGAPTFRGQWRGRQAQGQDTRTAEEAGRRAVRISVWTAGGRCPAGGVPDRAVDSQAGARRRGPRVWGAVQPDGMLGVAAQPGVLAAKAREARHAAQRRGDPGVEAQDLACTQKKERGARAEPSSS